MTNKKEENSKIKHTIFENISAQQLKSTRSAYGETLLKLGKNDNNIVVLDADLSSSTKTNLFAKEFPERFFNCGVAEANMMGISAGLAISGKKVFCSSFAIFATGRAYDQIRQSIAYPNLNVKIVATHGGLTVGEDGASHQMLEDIGLMRGLPNFTVIVAADANQTEKIVEEIYKFEGPVYVRLRRTDDCLIYEHLNFKIGKGYVLKEGKGVAIICCGLMVEKSLLAAKILEKNKISVGVIDMPTIKPLDKNLIIAAAKKYKILFTLEEHNIYNGLGSAISEVICNNMPTRVIRLGVNNTFGESGKANELLVKYGLDENSVAKKIQQYLNP